MVASGDNFNETIASMLTLVKGNYAGTSFPREGFVFRLRKNWDTPSERYSFKVINNDYLLKKDSKEK